MLTAKTVQEMLGVEDFDYIAYGYALNRETITFSFEDGKLIRTEDIGETGSCIVEESVLFDPSLFFKNTKRFYVDRTNPKLIELFETFGRGLPLVDLRKD